MAKEFGSCWFGVEAEGSRSKTITGLYIKVFILDTFECQEKKVAGCIEINKNLHKMVIFVKTMEKRGRLTTNRIRL